METIDKLRALAADARFDVCGYTGVPSPPSAERFIYHAALPGGGCTSLFKVLLTNVCVNDCVYCVNQVGRDKPRYAFQPEELARVFMQLRAKRMVQGIFLSSGIGANASRTEQLMIDTVDILRHRYEFDGYVHLKMLPGASFGSIQEACRLATRVSVNMEAPTAQHLARLSSRKNIHEGILQPMRWVRELTAKLPGLVPAGQTTQFVVGAAGETDRDLVHTTEALYHEVGLKRVYFSAFQPIPGTRLEGVSPTPPAREHRLYQVDWLLRVYGFSPREVELALGEHDSLDLKRDPKLLIAQRQPWLFPLDVNKASYDELMRVPGIGPTSAERIVRIRQDRHIDSVEQLRKMRIVVKRALPFLWFHGMLAWEKDQQACFLRQLDEEALPENMPEPTLAAAVG